MTTYDQQMEELYTRESLRYEALAWRKRYVDEQSKVAFLAAQNERLEDANRKLTEECQRLTAMVREQAQ